MHTGATTMTQVSHTLPSAGEYLLITFSELMYTPRFRKHVWTKMRLGERRRLDALRLQALYGDAPMDTSASAVVTNSAGGTKRSVVNTTSETKGSDAPTHTSPSSVAERGTDAIMDGASRMEKVRETPPFPASGSSLSSSPPGPPRWFDLAGRARYMTWVELRGRMSADVAAESFCAEFISLIKKYPHPTLLPLVEAALSTARGLVYQNHTTSSLRGALPTTAARGAEGTSAPPQAPTVKLQVRALQGDPAALALYWICRAYRLPCEFTVEPLSTALVTYAAGMLTSTALTGECKRDTHSEKGPTSPLPTTTTTTNPYLPYTMADACYPFTVSLIQPSDAGAAASPPTKSTVTTPEAAFVLLADTFLADYPHWMGVPSDPECSAARTPSSRVVERCIWVEELQHITRHVRIPILALLVHQATRRQRGSRMNPSAAAAERHHLLRAVASHLHIYERWTMDRVLSRRVHQVQSVLWPLLASTAVVSSLQQAYAPDAKVVSAADTYISSCGYVLCTHPFCADVFPLLRVPCALAMPLHDTVQTQWSSPANPVSEAVGETPTRSLTTSYVPWAVPLHLSGMPAEHNNLINQLLHREANGALQQEQHRRPVRLVIGNETEVNVSCAGGDGLGVSKKTASLTKAPQQQSRAGFYAISASSTAKEAAEAVQQLILSRMLSLRRDDLDRAAAAGSTSSVSGTPFLVMGHVFALTWALCQEQVPGFPFFMVDGNPTYDGGFSFSWEAAPQNASPADSARTSDYFQVSLAPVPVAATAAATDPSASVSPAFLRSISQVPSASSQDGGASLESRFRYGVKAATGTLLMRATRLLGSRPSVDVRADTGRSHNQSTGADTTRVLRCGDNSAAATPRVQSRL